MAMNQFDQSDDGSKSKKPNVRKPTEATQHSKEGLKIPRLRFQPFLTNPTHTGGNLTQSSLTACSAWTPSDTRSNTASMNEASEIKLPTEIWYCIATHASRASIASLMRTGSYLCNLLTPLLYRTVSLALKNIPYPPQHSFPSEEKRMKVRQDQFVRVILVRPELASHVRTLDWDQNHGSLLETDRAGLSFRMMRTYDQRLSTVLGLMQNVTTVILGSEVGLARALRGTESVKRLFPHAERITLRGGFDPYLVNQILHGTADDRDTTITRLISLTFENLCLVLDPTNRTVIQNGPSLESEEPLGYYFSTDFHERCRSLEIFHLRTSSLEPRPRRDNAQWTGWSTLMTSARPRHFIFDCARHVMHRARGTRPASVVANDRRFSQIMMPILRKGWEGLQRVTIKGGGKTVAEELLLLREQGVEVVIIADGELVDDLTL